MYRIRHGPLEIISPCRHAGTARRLVHRFKYSADLEAGRSLAAAMAGAAESDWTCLIPVPRALGRRLRYGIDPARWLAAEVGRMLDLPVCHGLRAGVWWPSRGGGYGGTPRFHGCRSQPVPQGAVLVDDVATTGTTLAAAAAVVDIRRAAVATAAIGAFSSNTRSDADV